MENTFGGFIKEKRLGLDLSLREFAKRVGMQPSNYCNVESDVLPPPPALTLERMVKELGLKKGTANYEQFHDLAGRGRDEVPADVARIVKERELIPAMLRTVENEKVTKAQLRGIIEDLKSGRYKKPAVKVRDYRLFELERMAAEALAGEERCVRDRRVDIERLILEKFELKIEAFHDLRRRWDTYAFIDTTGKVIFVDVELMDEDRLEKKYRFTLAEELAHFLIHRQVYAACKTIEHRLRIEETMDERTRDHLESNARALASALLMPKVTIEPFVEELAGTLVDEHGHVWVEELISAVARDYDVNFSAAKRRLRNLGYHHHDRLGLNLS